MESVDFNAWRLVIHLETGLQPSELDLEFGQKI